MQRRTFLRRATLTATLLASRSAVPAHAAEAAVLKTAINNGKYYELRSPHLDDDTIQARKQRNPDKPNLTCGLNLWLPDEVPVVRALIWLLPAVGGGSGGHWIDGYQNAARALDCGLLGMEDGLRMNREAVDALLDQFAETSGRGELRNVPVALIGMSRGASRSKMLALNDPERMLCFVSDKGFNVGRFKNDDGRPYDEKNLQENTRKVPALFLAGQYDAWRPFDVQGEFQTWRRQGSPAAFAVDWNVGHGSNDADYELGFYFAAECLKARYPEALPSTKAGNRVALKEVAPRQVWLGANSCWTDGDAKSGQSAVPAASSPFAAMAPAAEYKGDPKEASYLVTADFAQAWRAFASFDGVKRSLPTRDFKPPYNTSLRIAPAEFRGQGVRPYQVGEAVPLALDADRLARGFAGSLKQVEFFDGAQLLDTVTGPEWKTTFKPATPGLHGIVAVATGKDDQKTAGFRCVIVRPAR